MSTTIAPPPADADLPPGRRRRDRPRRSRWLVVCVVAALVVLGGSLLGLPSRAVSVLQPGHTFLAEEGALFLTVTGR